MTHASVFSGIGGPEVAATMLGWDNLFHCEINPFGRQVLDYWYPNSKSYEDITRTDFTEWRGRVDVLTGGFPCQPFSYAGQRRGAEDDRYLWPSMYRAIDEIQPTWVVAENVAGILTMVEQGEVSKVAGTAFLFDTFDDFRGRYELRETFTLQRICSDLESHGYAVQPVLVPACAVGAPHRRDRVFIVGRRATADTYYGRQSQSEPTRRQGEHETERERMDDSAQRKSENGNFANAAGNAPTDTANDRLQHGAESRGKGCETGTIQGQRNSAERDVSTSTNGNRWTSASTVSEDSMHGGQLHRPNEEQGSERNERHTCAGGGERICGKTSRAEDAGVAGLGRWRDFPSVSPVHRGNDGIPFPLDGLTISAGKWRTEALKAYGNAIVPQVMYEIFRAIEIVEQR